MIQFSKSFNSVHFSILCVLFLFGLSLNGQSNSNDSTLIDNYISSKGYGSTIVFDYKNIKQYWVDKSVISIDQMINVGLPSYDQKEWKSIPFRIQLANINPDDMCTVDIICKTKDYNYTITNSISQTISSSSSEPDFIQYSVKTASFSLQETPDNLFYINFSSSGQNSLSIYKIVLSFSKAKDRIFTYFNKNSLTLIKSRYLSDNDDNDAFSVTGKGSEIVPTEKTPVSDQLFKSSAIIKNMGKTPARVYFGYIAYLEDGTKLNGMYYPYDKTTLKVVSHEEESKTLIVAPYPQNWSRNTRIARNAKDDLSDIPNKAFINNPVVDIKQLDDDQGEITLQNPLNTALHEGEKIRLHLSPMGYLYSAIKVLNPGDEAVFVSSTKKDDDNISYSPNSLPKGTFYVVPVILSHSVDSSVENTIQIKTFSFSY